MLRTQAKRFIAKRRKKSRLQGLDLSKRRESEIGREWRGGEAVRETEGVGSRQWRVDSGSEADPVTRADRQLRCSKGKHIRLGAEPPERGVRGGNRGV
jgi:hypothetical protein